MTLATFYLICFLVGLLLSLVTLIIGHLDLHVHLPHGGAHVDFGGHGGHAGGVHAAHGDHGVQHGDGDLSPINFATVTAFLAWFGGAGYILTQFSTLWRWLALGAAIVAGFAGAAVVFWFFGKLAKSEHVMDPADYQMVGLLGRISSSVREGGTGEIVYVQGGTRHAVGARSEDGTAIAKDEEVVVTRYEKGIAYVRRWKELAQEEDVDSGSGGQEVERKFQELN